jgi:Leucine-rich repeat (LRR) protein
MELPVSMGNLVKLTNLNADRNNLQSLPEELGLYVLYTKVFCLLSDFCSGVTAFIRWRIEMTNWVTKCE